MPAGLLVTHSNASPHVCFPCWCYAVESLLHKGQDVYKLLSKAADAQRQAAIKSAQPPGQAKPVVPLLSKQPQQQSIIPHYQPSQMFPKMEPIQGYPYNPNPFDKK